MIWRMAESEGVASARSLLVGRAVSEVAFVRDYVELRFDGPVFRALSSPYGRRAGVAWRFPDENAPSMMLEYIGETVDSFTFVDDQFVELGFGANIFGVSLDYATRTGSEALNIVGVDEIGETSVGGGLWVW